jgi:hypothetical protein
MIMESRKSWAVCMGCLTIILVSVIMLSEVFLSTANAKEKEDQERYKYYTSIQLESGDTLWDIANEYMTKEYSDADAYIREVKEINYLSSDDITAGMYLIVPYYSDEIKN